MVICITGVFDGLGDTYRGFMFARERFGFFPCARVYLTTTMLILALNRTSISLRQWAQGYPCAEVDARLARIDIRARSPRYTGIYAMLTFVRCWSEQPTRLYGCRNKLWISNDSLLRSCESTKVFWTYSSDGRSHQKHTTNFEECVSWNMPTGSYVYHAVTAF